MNCEEFLKKINDLIPEVYKSIKKEMSQHGDGEIKTEVSLYTELMKFIRSDNFDDLYNQFKYIYFPKYYKKGIK
jgi:hypothetical protein